MSRLLSIVAAVRTCESGGRWLASVQAQATAAGAEIIVVGPGVDERWAVEGEIVVESASAAALTPELWTRGILRSSGEAVALTIADCVPAADWVPAIGAALQERPDAAAIGGVLELDPRGSAADWALYFLRYSAYMPPLPPAAAREIAADNAVYRRFALDRYEATWHAGFWEPAVHARFREDGLKILLDPRIVVFHQHSLSPGAFARQRFLHGRVFAATRFGGASVRLRALRALAAPLAGAVLAERVTTRVLARRRHLWRFVASLPYLAGFIASWIAGETSGYLQW